MPPPTHAAHQRVLDAAAPKGVELDIVRFGQSTHTAEDAARAVGAELGQIVKSLVFVVPGPERRGYLCLVSGANRVDVRRLAAVVGEPQVQRATAREATELTGFTIGGIPPIGHTTPLRVVMDPDLGRFPIVWAAAGTPDSVFSVPPATLRMLCNAVVAPIAQEVQQPREAPDPEEAPAHPVEPQAVSSLSGREGAGQPQPERPGASTAA